MNNDFIVKLAKFIITVVGGFAIAQISPPEGLTRPAMIYLGVFSSMIIVMVMGLFPDYISTLMALVALLFFKVAEFEVVFSAFAGSTIWLVIVIVGFTTGINKSGLITRLAFIILRFFPNTFRGQALAIMTTAGVLCPFIPNTPAKVAVLAPFAAAISREVGFEKGSKGAAGLFSAMYVPANILGLAFLTGSTMVFLLLGFLPPETRTQFTWVFWFLCCAVWFVVHMVLTYLVVVTYYKPENAISLQPDFAKKRLQQLGPISKDEKLSALILAVAITMWVTSNIHGIDIFVVAAVAFAIMAIYGLVTVDDFQTKIPWSFVVLLGCIISLANLMSITGIGNWIALTLGPVLDPLVYNVWILVPTICILTYLLRYAVISLVASLTIMFAIFAPLVGAAGINPWLIAFVAYVSTQVWNLSFHNISYIQAEAFTGGNMITYKSVFPMSIAFMVINLIACMASIPVWKILGLIA